MNTGKVLSTFPYPCNKCWYSLQIVLNKIFIFIYLKMCRNYYFNILYPFSISIFHIYLSLSFKIYYIIVLHFIIAFLTYRDM